MTRSGIETRSPRSLANTLPTRPMSRFCTHYLSRNLTERLLWLSMGQNTWQSRWCAVRLVVLHTHTHTHTHKHTHTHIYIYMIWKSDLTDKMKRSFFQAAVVSILLYGCTTWTLTKRLEKKLDGNYTRKLQAILNKSWRQNPTRRQLYGHLPPITKTIRVRRTRYAGHCWRSRDELISDVLLWTPTYGRAKNRTTSLNIHTAAM